MLGGGRTIGGGHTPSRDVFYLSDCLLECLVGEVAYKGRFVCKGFFYKALSSKGARLDWD